MRSRAWRSRSSLERRTKIAPVARTASTISAVIATTSLACSVNKRALNSFALRRALDTTHLDKAITAAPDGLNFDAGARELGAQVDDVHVHGARAEERRAPHQLE